MKFQTGTKLRGDLVAIPFHYNDDTGHRSFSPTIRVGCTVDDALRRFGELFERIAFGALMDGSSDFGYRSMAPAIVCEVHKLTICGADAGAVQPEIVKVKPIEGRREVAVDIRLPINMKGRKTLAGTVAMEFGAVIEVELEASQMSLELPATGGKKKGPFGNPVQVLTDGGGTETTPPAAA